MSCQLRHDITVIRGDTRTLFVGLSGGWANIADDPSLYRGRLVFRERQDDNLPDILAVEAEPEPYSDPANQALRWMLNFTMTPAETEALPTYSIVHFCEIRTTDGAFVQRLFEGRVRQRD